MKGIEIKDRFYLNGEPFQLISGAVHYFRIVPQYWQDRLEKLKAMGCNTVETYIPWNIHEPRKGEFHFDGMCDIGHFLDLAEELGLRVILRPSPYICAEWEFGGLPAWLLKEDGMKLRCSYEPYQKLVREYYSVLMPYLAPYQIDQGGPVIMMQIENEYGYYGDDHSYMEWMRDLMREYGITVPLFTSDGPFDDSFRGGRIDGILQTGNFGSKAEERFDFMRKYVDGPLSCMEFWLGWFDNWGCGQHHRTSCEENTRDFAYMLDHGNVNIYMFIGGTNFGFMNGSNYYDELTPDVTSYDYDAILTEDGQTTEKYAAFQAEIEKRMELPKLQLHTKISRKNYGTAALTGSVSLWDALPLLSEKAESTFPVSMEKLDQSYGYILYRTVLKDMDLLGEIRLMKANDRAQIFADDKKVLTLYDRELLTAHKLETPVSVAAEGSRMDILVENMGRVNFGPYMEQQRKGIDGPVLFNTRQHFGFEIYPLPLDDVSHLKFEAKAPVQEAPAFHRYTFEAEETGDTFLNMEGFGKGCVFINGFNLGRFWEIGPQRTLYVPGPLLKRGINEIIVFETEGTYRKTVTLQDQPDLGPQ